MDPALMTPSDVLYEQNLPKYLELFTELLAKPKVSPSIISNIIINDHTTAVPTALALSTYAVAKSKPTSTDRILSTVQTALDDDHVRAVLLTDDVDHIPEEVFYVFDREFNEHISDEIYVPHSKDLMDTDELEYGNAEDEYMVVKATLVQSFAARLGLTDSVHHIRVARQGLGLEDIREDSKTREVLATAALVVFLVLGAENATRAIAAEGGSYQGVFAALMNIRRSGILKSNAARSALDVSTHFTYLLPAVLTVF
ncbi:hypothetical protein NMY22_g8338 [Coprinellus aureogranulatus]|nr:hypothetical protein NMY22_g8338 [Coprinellus aureogranulatus]